MKEIKSWKNNPLLIGLTFLLSVLTGLAGVGVFALGYEIVGFSYGLWGVGVVTVAVLRAALWLFALARRTARSEARFDPEGFQLVYEKTKPESAQRMGWGDIAAVSESGGFNNVVTIQLNDGRDISFNAGEFFFPARLGKAVARRAGKNYID